MTATAATVRRQVRLVRRTGEAAPHHHVWGCRIDAEPDGLRVRVAAPDRPCDIDLDTPAARLHETLLDRAPRMLRAVMRSETGVVRTELPDAVLEQRYALATCADVVVLLTGELTPEPVVPWRGTSSRDELDPRLPVVLGPSAVLSLATGLVELTDSARPEWLSVRTVPRSPYPPHDVPAGAEDPEVNWWIAHTEHWMRPLRTTRSSRGRYDVRAALPPVRAQLPAVRIESLVSLDTEGRTWHASLSVERDGGRFWLTRPVPVHASPAALLGRAHGQVEPPEAALDRDPVDGESFGWAPALVTDATVAELGIGRRPA